MKGKVCKGRALSYGALPRYCCVSHHRSHHQQERCVAKQNNKRLFDGSRRLTFEEKDPDDERLVGQMDRRPP